MDNLGLAAEAGLAAVPILAVIVLLIGVNWTAARAGVVGASIAIVLALTVFGLGDAVLPQAGPFGAVSGATAEALFAAVSILAIIVPALSIYELSKHTGALEVMQAALGRLTDDPRLLTLLVAWFFSVFMEGAAGFGSAVALTAPLLVAAGFTPVTAVVVPMLGHGVGVSFGAVGTPIVPQVAATSLAPLELARTTATLHLILGGLLLALLMRLTMRAVSTGELTISDPGTLWRPARAVWAWTAFAAAALLIPYWLLAAYVGPELPSLGGAAVGAGIFAVALVRLRRATGAERVASGSSAAGVGARDAGPQRTEILRATSPYLALITAVLLTRLLPGVPEALNGPTLGFDLFDGAFTGSLAPLYHPGTLLFVGLVAGALAQGVSMGQLLAVVGRTVRGLGSVALALAAMLVLSRILVAADMVTALAEAAAASLGSYWPIAAGLVGVLGTFVTGSATASNILFTDLQAAAAEAGGSQILPVVAAQNAGAAVGNAICPHNIVAAGATVDLGGQEGVVLRRTLGPVVLYAFLVGVAALLFAL